MEERRVIEINGVKIDIDLRTAERVESLRVGDRVKVLKKKYDGYDVFPGTVVGFEPFRVLPTIIVAYLQMSYQSSKVEFLYYNAQSKDVEIVASVDPDQLVVEKANILNDFQREIDKRKNEIDDLESKLRYFLDNFGAYFNETAKVDPGRVA